MKIFLFYFLTQLFFSAFFAILIPEILKQLRKYIISYLKIIVTKEFV